MWFDIFDRNLDQWCKNRCILFLLAMKQSLKAKWNQNGQFMNFCHLQNDINTQWRVFLLRWRMFTCGRSALSPPDKTLITCKKTATQLIPKQMWWALSMVHPLWAFWCGETCWSAVSSFSNKAVISCQCALSWRRSKLAEINSACQGAVPRRNKAGRHMVSRPQGGSRQRWLIGYGPWFQQGDMTLCLHMGWKKRGEKKRIGHARIEANGNYTTESRASGDTELFTKRGETRYRMYEMQGVAVFSFCWHSGDVIIPVSVLWYHPFPISLLGFNIY